MTMGGGFSLFTFTWRQIPRFARDDEGGFSLFTFHFSLFTGSKSLASLGMTMERGFSPLTSHFSPLTSHFSPLTSHHLPQLPCKFPISFRARMQAVNKQRFIDLAFLVQQ